MVFSGLTGNTTIQHHITTPTCAASTPSGCCISITLPDIEGYEAGTEVEVILF